MVTDQEMKKINHSPFSFKKRTSTFLSKEPSRNILQADDMDNSSSRSAVSKVKSTKSKQRK